jgi:hypothetical protein
MTSGAMPRSRVRNVKLRLRMARVMFLDAFREQARAATLARKYRATVRLREWLACKATSAAFQEI